MYINQTFRVVVRAPAGKEIGILYTSCKIITQAAFPRIATASGRGRGRPAPADAAVAAPLHAGAAAARH